MRFVQNRDSGQIFYVDAWDRERLLESVPAEELRLALQHDGLRPVAMMPFELDTLVDLDELLDAAFVPLERFGHSIMALTLQRRRRPRRHRRRRE
jgi:hypothetical protein